MYICISYKQIKTIVASMTDCYMAALIWGDIRHRTEITSICVYFNSLATLLNNMLPITATWHRRPVMEQPTLKETFVR
jgi:hypothetical protein